MRREHGREEARETGCGWEEEASVWQALQTEVLYFLFFPLCQLVSLTPSPPITIINIISFHTFFSHSAYQLCLLMFVLLLFLVWSLLLRKLNSGNWDSHVLFPHSFSYPTRYPTHTPFLGKEAATLSLIPSVNLCPRPYTFGEKRTTVKPGATCPNS